MTTKTPAAERPLSPRAVLLAEVDSALSLWGHGRDHPDIGPVAARDVLSHWAGLHRLEGERPEVCEPALHRAVTTQTVALGEVSRSLAVNFAEQWGQKLQSLSQSWDATDPTASADAVADLAWEAHLLLEDLDRLQLAAWTLDRLLPPGHPLRADWAKVRAQTDAAEEQLAERPDVFVARGRRISALLSALRPGLQDEEPDLWATVLKFRRIEEEQDLARSSGSPLLAPTPVPGRALSEPRPGPRPAEPAATRGHHTLVAAVGVPDPIIKTLACDTPPETTADYRGAWAHFLVCCSRREFDVAKRWLELFVHSAGAARELPAVWQERMGRVRDLTARPNWKSKVDGPRVFSLDSGTLNEESLPKRLRELLDPDAVD